MKEKELRDEFAMAALPGVIEAVGQIDLDVTIATIAYQIADACMKEREKP